MAVTQRWKSLPPTLTAVLALLRIVMAANRRAAITVSLGIGLAALLPIAATIVTGWLVGSIPRAESTGIESEPGRATLALLAGVAVFIIGQRVLSPFLTMLGAVLGREVDWHLKERIMRAVIAPARLDHLDDAKVLDLLRVVRGLGMDSSRPDQAVAALVILLPLWIQSWGSAIVLMAFHWWLGLAWLIMWPIMLYYLQRGYLKIGEVGYRRSGALRRAEYLRDLALTPAAAKELRVWGMLDWLIGRFEGAWQSAMTPVWKARNYSPAFTLGVGVVSAVINFGSYGLLALAASKGDISLGALAIFTQAVSNAGVFAAFDDSNASLMFGALAVPKVLDLEQRLENENSAAKIPAPVVSRTIQFEAVRFRYPHASSDAVGPLDLNITAGHSLAIVGDNGAGKSTLVKLLCGLYEPTDGRMTVDGIGLNTVDPVSWQNQIGVLFQDFARYHLPARDNVALRASGGENELELLRAAAERAGALDLIESLPNGWDTVLSSQYSGGVDLSGGQWQRVALARAMYAVQCGAQVLVLDEPTAALDARAEAELYDRFLEITAGLTTILISHRFSTVRRAERIVVLRDGQIREDGSHDELMAVGGLYSEMFLLQAARFQVAGDA